ncbi:MAG TPA: hypothetical protein VFK04_17585 [Gemmatimonadaceae bacterium]|nr:hypothetical protein [Gemmatimonadaceae bacterium]
MRLAAAMVGLAALSLSACSVDKILDVTDPDIINPSDVSSPQGVEAVRLGTIARLNQATTGAESFFLLGGLLADEWRSGDSYLDRDETDQRNVSERNGFLVDATRNVYRARLSAKQTIDLLKQYSPDAPGWQAAEMYFVEAYMENMIAENFCSGMPFSTVEDGAPVFGSPMSTEETLTMALAHADSGLALVTGTTDDDNRVKYVLQVMRGRILLNLDRAADAANAVAGVPTDFAYVMEQSQTTMSNTIWDFNINVRRYTVSAGEGIVGTDFATAGDPRVPVCAGGSTECKAAGITQSTVFENGSAMPLYVQLLWSTPDASVTIVSGVEARLIEAEAALQGSAPGDALGILNDLRSTVPGLDPLDDAGTPEARVDQLFHERAFWLFSTGHRLGDLRRLVRQYDRAPDTVFPNGDFLEGGTYGSDMNFPVPESEKNNPNDTAGACIDRNA